MLDAVIHGTRLEVRHIPGAPELAPLVFLHEGLGCVAMWTQRGRDWPRQLCAATGRSGWLYSRRGYGQSDPVPDVRGAPRSEGFWHVGRHEPNYMHLEAFEVLPRLLARLEIRSPVLVGHSDGATIALLHASRHPVTATVAMAPHVVVEELSIRSIEQARNAYVSPGEGHLRTRLARYHRDVDNAFWQWNDVWLSPAFRHFDIRSDCGRIPTPVLAIQGADDEYGTLQQIQDIQHQLPSAQTMVLPQCGHSPHRDHPDALTEAVVRFVAPLG